MKRLLLKNYLIALKYSLFFDMDKLKKFVH